MNSIIGTPTNDVLARPAVRINAPVVAADSCNRRLTSQMDVPTPANISHGISIG